MRRGLLGLSGLLLLPVCATAHASTWTALGSVPIGTGRVPSSQIRVARTIANEIVVATARGTSDPRQWVAQAYRADGSAAPEQPLGDPGTSLDGLGTDARGTVYALLNRGTGLVLRRREPGGTFGPEEQVVRGPVESAALAVDPRGDVGVSFENVDGDQRRWSVASARAGQAFTVGDVTGSQPVAWMDSPEDLVAIAADGEVIAMRVLDTPTGADETAVEITETAAGSGVATAQSLETGPGPRLCSALAAGPTGRAVAAWHDGYNCSRSGPVMVSLREPGGRFGPVSTPSGNDADAAQVGMTSSGTAVLAYDDSSGSQIATAPAGSGFRAPVHGPGYLSALSGGLATFQQAYGPSNFYAHMPEWHAASASIAADGTSSDLSDLRVDCHVDLLGLATDPAGRGVAVVREDSEGPGTFPTDPTAVIVLRQDAGTGTAGCLPIPLPPAAPAPAPVVAIKRHARAVAITVTGESRDRLHAVATVQRAAHRFGRAAASGRPPLTVRVRLSARRLHRARHRHARVVVVVTQGSRRWRTDRPLR